jgi:hypothetical protein
MLPSVKEFQLFFSPDPVYKFTTWFEMITDTDGHIGGCIGSSVNRQGRPKKGVANRTNTDRLILRALNHESVFGIDFGSNDPELKLWLSRYGLTDDRIQDLRDYVKDVLNTDVSLSDVSLRSNDDRFSCDITRTTETIQGKMVPVTVYHFRSLYDLLMCECSEMLRSLEMIAQCNQCGKYFITKTRRGSKFCSQSCRRKSSDASKTPAERERDQAYKKNWKYYRDHFKKYSKGDAVILPENALALWCRDADKKLMAVNRGDISMKEFKAFCGQRLDEYCFPESEPDYYKNRKNHRPSDEAEAVK